MGLLGRTVSKEGGGTDKTELQTGVGVAGTEGGNGNARTWSGYGFRSWNFKN